LFVQLPLFGKPEANTGASSWAIVREAQAAALKLPAVGMACALDLGEWNDLHPVKKKPLGYRLALAAESVVYGESSPAYAAGGPTLRHITREGDALLLTFDHCGTGLAAEGPLSMSIVPEDGKPVRRPAHILRQNRVSVNIAGIAGAQKILYAWADNPADQGLRGSDGLPAIPFRQNIPQV
jgi:sialate O-acetylesterase